ncbi:hypothetical protein V565_198290 [Rhizoctonia solani 123E]|uniref:Delta-endotoxin CytB n=1 Tax=Rhizoctonia solani 123E TaxID=1423351 RepID=A0A074S8T4_9AGAM|nr:hypothetical protein V565_198290 [Rhizoctonia solani 123E]
MSDKPAFDHYSGVSGLNASPANELYASPASELMKFTGYFLDVQTQHFDWQRYQTTIVNRPDKKLVVEEFESADISRQHNIVSAMVDKIGDVLNRVAGSDAGFDRDAMTERVNNAFTSLEIKEDSGFASWERSGSNSAFTYRIIFDVPSKDTTDLPCLVTTVKLMADIYEKSSWFGLSNTSRYDFSASVDAMRLACSKDFVAGPKP